MTDCGLRRPSFNPIKERGGKIKGVGEPRCEQQQVQYILVHTAYTVHDRVTFALPSARTSLFEAVVASHQVNQLVILG